MSASTLLGRLAFGALGSKYDMRRLVVAFYCIQLAALAILLVAPSISLVYAYAVLFGISFGGLTVAAPAFIGAYFERARFVGILSVVFPLGIVVEAIGPVMAGAIYDATNTYVAAFAVVVALCAAGLAYAISVRRS
jgi:cyanate permease